MTYVHNEAHTLPVWLRYYQRHFAREDMFVLDHGTDDGSTRRTAIPRGVRVLRLEGDAKWMPHAWLNRQVEAHVGRMLLGGYRCVLLAEVDDMVAADPLVYPGGLAQMLREFVSSSARYHRTVGYELSHVSEGKDVEPELDWSRSILAQRRYWGHNPKFDKPYLTKEVLRWGPGFHATTEPPIAQIPRHAALRLIHLHHADRTYCDRREAAKHAEFLRLGMHANELKSGVGARVGKFYDMLQARRGICTWAHARRRNATRNALGQLLERISDAWRRVEI